jgi:hypothetical protein
MTDLSPDIQAKLRAQAEALELAISTTHKHFLRDCVVCDCVVCQRVIEDTLRETYALGVSSERARQQGVITAWNALADELSREGGWDRDVIRLRLCADELRSTQTHVCDDSCPANEYHYRTGEPLR